MGYKRKTPRVVMACLFVILVSWTGVVVAQKRANAQPQQRQGWWEKEDVRTELGLSSAQVSAIAAIEEQNREITKQSRASQQKAYRNMVKLLTVVSPSEEEIAEGREVLEEAWAGSVRQSVNHWVKLRGELSSEQWEKVPTVAPRALQLGGLRTRAMGTVRVGKKSD